jgi:hypothetical protein
MVSIKAVYKKTSTNIEKMNRNPILTLIKQLYRLSSEHTLGSELCDIEDIQDCVVSSESDDDQN